MIQHQDRTRYFIQREISPGWWEDALLDCNEYGFENMQQAIQYCYKLDYSYLKPAGKGRVVEREIIHKDTVVFEKF